MKIQKNCVLFAIALLALIALIGSAQAAPNITVTKNHPGYVFVDFTNVMTAYVENSGDTIAAGFNVSIEITNTTGTLYAYKATGVSVDAGVKEEVSLGNWKPTKVENITINVTADCDNTTAESNETDNSRIENRNTTGGCADSGYTNTMLEKECFGFRGQHPLTEAYVGGSDVIYTVGDYKYQNTTVNFTIGAPGGDVNRADSFVADIPVGATIEQATLYLYHAWRRLDTYGYPDWTMNFTNSTGTYAISEAVNYTDCKGFGTSYMRERIYGTIVYDVTNYVTGNGTYTANVTGEIHPLGGLSTSYGYATGMALMVVYDDGSSKAYRIAHGYDRLATLYQYSATSKSSYHILPEDATTSATLTDAYPFGDVTYAKLFTTTVDGVDYTTGSPAGESLKCNDCAWNEGAWSNDGMGDFNHPIGFSRDEVTNCLSGAGTAEIVYFQERDTSTNKNGYSVVFAMLAITKAEAAPIFDTHAPANPYPSIMGVHEGKIIPSCNINASRLYTYPCTGTGGHTKSIELRENDYLIANGTWSGYIGDYHNITLQNVTGAPYVTLQKDHEYNYTIRTGSYPQIIHEKSKVVTGGTITCTKFVDANGKEYNDWIPAIRLWKE
ncbi:MAG: hypothetical protein KAT65_27365 [Methanophagales archaeon]|nr:hypothetical protein [Methanophagales archaeon]